MGKTHTWADEIHTWLPIKLLLCHLGLLVETSRGFLRIAAASMPALVLRAKAFSVSFSDLLDGVPDLYPQHPLQLFQPPHKALVLHFSLLYLKRAQWFVSLPGPRRIQPVLEASISILGPPLACSGSWMYRQFCVTFIQWIALARTDDKRTEKAG